MKFSSSSLRKLAEVFLLLASLAYIGSYFLVAFSRMTYPYDLEWLEGGLAGNVLRLVEGKPLYTAPSSEFYSFPYMPLYYYIVWAFSGLFGLHYWVGRLVSILASICIGLLLSRIIYRQTKSGFLALLVPGLFFASFHYTGSFYDLFRVDSVAYAFALGAFYASWFWPSTRGALFGAFLLCMAIFTKQTIMPFIPFGVLFLLPKGRRAALVFGLSCLLIMALGITWLSISSGGWFYELCIRKSSSVGFNLLSGAEYVLNNLLFKTPLISLGIVLWLIWFLFARRSGDKDGSAFSAWAWPFAAGLLVFLLTRSGYSGWKNDAIPMVVFGLLFVGIFWGYVRRQKRRLFEWLLCIAAGIQFVLFIYSPIKEIPSRADREAGDRFMNTLGRYDGEISMMFHPFYPVFLGKRPSFHADELFFYYVQGGRDPEMADLPDDLLERIKGRYYAAIVLDYDRMSKRQVTGTDLVEVRKLGSLIDKHYYLAERLFEKEDPSFWPRTGWKIRPDFLYLPR